MNFLHLDPIRALFTSAVINGLVAPPLLLLIILLGADRKIMKRHVSGKLSLSLTGIATAFMGLGGIATVVTLIAAR
jgi:Mn2+/Fe2+ NRAMP family transporter